MNSIHHVGLLCFQHVVYSRGRKERSTVCPSAQPFSATVHGLRSVIWSDVDKKDRNIAYEQLLPTVAYYTLEATYGYSGRGMEFCQVVALLL